MHTFLRKHRKQLWVLLFGIFFLFPAEVDAATRIISSDASGHVYQHTHDGSCGTSACPGTFRGWYGGDDYNYYWPCPVCGRTKERTPCIPGISDLSGLRGEYMTFPCEYSAYSCGYSDGQTWRQAHSNTVVKDSDATCTEPQYSHNHCNICGYNSVRYAVGDRLGHVWTLENSAVTTPPTVYETGVRTFTCCRDGAHTATAEEPKRLFRLFGNEKRITRLYSGDTLIYDVCAGEEGLTVPGGVAALPAP